MTLASNALSAKARIVDRMAGSPVAPMRGVLGASPTKAEWLSRVTGAATFGVSSDIESALLGAARAYPVNETAILYRDELPSVDGCVYFERPVEPSGEQVFCWHVIGHVVGVIALVPPGHPRAAQAVSAMVSFPLDVPASTFPVDWRTDQAAPVPFEGRGANFTFQLLATFLAFIRQRIFLVRPERAQRQVRRALARAGKDGDEDVRVVILRQAVSRHGDPEAEARAVEWSCRWIVSGHWTNQWYPSRQRHERIWLMPYVKGPDDKPLRVTEKVWAVTR